jgi:hypothetical protein
MGINDHEFWPWLWDPTKCGHIYDDEFEGIMMCGFPEDVHARSVKYEPRRTEAPSTEGKQDSDVQ